MISSRFYGVERVVTGVKQTVGAYWYIEGAYVLKFDSRNHLYIDCVIDAENSAVHAYEMWRQENPDSNQQTLLYQA